MDVTGSLEAESHVMEELLRDSVTFRYMDIRRVTGLGYSFAQVAREKIGIPLASVLLKGE